MPVFEPPTAPLAATLPGTWGPARDLFRHYDWLVGRTVLKTGGVYEMVSNPTVDQIAAASEVYLGGHVYTVDGATAAALTAAGYGAGIT